MVRSSVTKVNWISGEFDRLLPSGMEYHYSYVNLHYKYAFKI